MSIFDTVKYVDCSDEEKFVFGIFCPECNTLYKSREIFFSCRGQIPKSKEKKIILQILYQKEKAIAKDRAEKELASRFNICPVCGLSVCDKCFLICDELDMCKSCAKELNEKGETVENE